jgi:hypothetical protein
MTEMLKNSRGEDTSIILAKLNKLDLNNLDKFDALYFAKFSEHYQEGDEFHFYRDFGVLSGWGGYVLTRNGAFVARLVTMRS